MTKVPLLLQAKKVLLLLQAKKVLLLSQAKKVLLLSQAKKVLLLLQEKREPSKRYRRASGRITLARLFRAQVGRFHLRWSPSSGRAGLSGTTSRATATIRLTS